MAHDGDEDEIWNYKIKATPRNKPSKGPEAKMIEEGGSCNHAELNHKESDFIVIGSDDEDVFSEKAKTRQQQTEQWKHFMVKDTGKSSTRGDGPKTKASKGKKNLSVTNEKSKTKQSKRSSLLKAEGTNSLKTQKEEPSTEISSSPQNLKNYYSPAKIRNSKRKTPEPDDFLSKGTVLVDQAMEPEFPVKKKFSRHDNEGHCCILLDSKGDLESKSLSSDSSRVSDDPLEAMTPKKSVIANAQSSIDCPQAVNVIVMEENLNQSDDLVKEFTTEEDQEPGGFLMDDEADLFAEDSENENMKPNENDLINQDCAAGDQLSRSSTPKHKVSDDKVKKSSACYMAVQNSASESSDSADLTAHMFDDKAALSPSKPRKQTSLFSFFKARPSTSLSKGNSQNASGLEDAQLKSVYNVSSRPSLRSISSTSWSSSMSNENKISLSKSASDGSGVVTQPKAGKGIQGFTNKKQCPFYKKIPGTSITVDAFRYGVIPGCEAYFLTHFHYDHYGGLTKKFSQPIFCTQVTGNLVESRLGVDKKWINPLPMWKPCVVADATLTLMEANHCPGAVIVLFETKDGKKILHTGDFRACPEMEDYVMLKGLAIDELYLDTTYCNPSYAFPSQKEVIDFVVNLVEEYISAHPKTLVVCGAYTIGKEKIFSAIAKILDSKICVMSDKKKVLDCLEDKELKSRITLNWSLGRVHVLPMGKLNLQSLREHHERHAHFTSILAFEPTGWTHSSKSSGLSNLRPKWTNNNITLYGVPYSEHSSFLELKRFVQYVQPKRILPTVNNGNPASRNKMEAIFKTWENEKRNPPSVSSSSKNQSKMDLWMA